MSTRRLLVPVWAWAVDDETLAENHGTHCPAEPSRPDGVGVEGVGGGGGTVSSWWSAGPWWWSCAPVRVPLNVLPTSCPKGDCQAANVWKLPVSQAMNRQSPT